MDLKIISMGNFRPFQGAVQVYALYYGVRGVIAGPIPGQALSAVYGNDPGIVTYLFYISFIIGAALAMSGEIRQLRCPLVKPGCLAKYIDALYIEASGTILIGLNYCATGIAILAANNVPNERAVVYFSIGLIGGIGRTCQAIWDAKRLKKGINDAVNKPS